METSQELGREACAQHPWPGGWEAEGRGRNGGDKQLAQVPSGRDGCYGRSCGGKLTKTGCFSLSKDAYETLRLRTITHKERETSVIEGGVVEGRQAAEAWGQSCLYFYLYSEANCVNGSSCLKNGHLRPHVACFSHATTGPTWQYSPQLWSTQRVPMSHQPGRWACECHLVTL